MSETGASPGRPQAPRGTGPGSGTAREALLARARGRVWELTVPPDALARLRDQHPVSKMVRTRDGVRVRLLASAAPAADAAPVPPDLEDAYLTIVHGAAPRAAAGASR